MINAKDAWAITKENKECIEKAIECDDTNPYNKPKMPTSKIKCVLSIKEFSVTDGKYFMSEPDKTTHYVAIYPSDIAEDVVDKAIRHKFESLGNVDYKQIIIVQKEQYDLVLKPQMDILSKYNQSIMKGD